VEVSVYFETKCLVMRSKKLKYTGNVILLGSFKQRDHMGNLDVDRSQNGVTET
jgi:hypothetical protein